MNEMNDEYNVRITPEIGAFLLSLKGSLGKDIAQGDEGFQVAVDAFKRGWITADGAGDQQGNVFQLHISGLSEFGYRLTDMYECALEERKLPKRAKRLLKTFLKWFFGSVERVLLTILGSDMVLRWLTFFFKD